MHQDEIRFLLLKILARQIPHMTNITITLRHYFTEQTSFHTI